MKKAILKCIVCIILIITILVGGYIYTAVKDGDVVITCNENEISQGVYTMYMITEAAKMDRSAYESDAAFFVDLQETVLDKICIDTYYATMCKEEGYSLTATEKAEVEMELVAKMVMLGFDYNEYDNNQAYWEYFRVSKGDFLEFYTRKALYDKYFLAMAGQTREISDDLRSQYQKFTERQQAQEKIEAYRNNLANLNRNVSQYFSQHRYDYARNYIDVVFMKYPTDENGQVTEATKEKYAQKASEVYAGFQEGMYIHQFEGNENFGAYVTSAGKMYVDNSNAVRDLYGDEFIETCLEGQENRIYKVVSDYGIAVFKVLEVGGQETNWDEIALIVKTKDMGNKVRKAILAEEYEPIILNQTFYDSFTTSLGQIWQNLLEK